MILKSNSKKEDSMVLVSNFTSYDGVSKSTIYSLKSKGGELNNHRFAKIDGRVYVLCDDYKHPFTSEITSLSYRAIEIYGSEYAVIKRICKMTNLSFSTVKGLLYRGAFKNAKNAIMIIEALKKIGEEGLF